MEQKSANNIKTFLLLAAISGAIVALGYVLAGATGNSSYIMYALIIAVVQNIVSYFFSDKIALSSSGAIVADEQKYSDLHEIVATLAGKEGFAKPAVYVINDPAPNAFATGRNQSHAAIAATTGLLAMLNRGELEGVLAHEMSHIKNKDILIMSVVVVMSTVLSTLANFAMHASFVGNKDRANNIFMTIVGVVASLIIPIAAVIVQASVSRKREFMADATGALLTGYPEGLASALEKISSYKQPMQKANPATAHLFISSPFGPGLQNVTFFQKLFATHPPIEERIAVLRNENI